MDILNSSLCGHELHHLESHYTLLSKCQCSGWVCHCFFPGQNADRLLGKGHYLSANVPKCCRQFGWAVWYFETLSRLKKFSFSKRKIIKNIFYIYIFVLFTKETVVLHWSSVLMCVHEQFMSFRALYFPFISKGFHSESSLLSFIPLFRHYLDVNSMSSLAKKCGNTVRIMMMMMVMMKFCSFTDPQRCDCLMLTAADLSLCSSYWLRRKKINRKEGTSYIFTTLPFGLIHTELYVLIWWSECGEERSMGSIIQKY